MALALRHLRHDVKPVLSAFAILFGGVAVTIGAWILVVGLMLLLAG